MGLVAELAGDATAAQGLAREATDVRLDGSLAAGLARERHLLVELFGTDGAHVGLAVFQADRSGHATES